MCEPQSVSTAATYLGLRGLETSKTRRPSQADFSVADSAVLEQESSLRLASTLITRMFLWIDRSPCPPGQNTCATRLGSVGFLMSKTWKPL